MSDRVTKFIESLDKKTRRRLREKLEAIKADPYGMRDVKKLTEWGALVYRLRVGTIRIIYRLHNGHVEILDIDHRGHIHY